MTCIWSGNNQALKEFSPFVLMIKDMRWKEMKATTQIFKWVSKTSFNSSPAGQFGGKMANDIFNYISFNENVWISIKMSLKFIPKGQVDNKSVLFQVMAWCHHATSHYLNQCWPSSLTHICDSPGRWVKVRAQDRSPIMATRVTWPITSVLFTTMEAEDLFEEDPFLHTIYSEIISLQI